MSLDGGLRGSPEGVTTGQPRAGRGATGELGTGLQGGAPHGGRRVSPGYVYTGDSVRGGVPMRIAHAGHTGGYAMSGQEVCGGTIGGAPVIRPSQCPTRPFGPSLFYLSGAISGLRFTPQVTYVSH